MTATLIAKATMHGVRLVGDAIALALGVLWALFAALVKSLLPPPHPKAIAGEIALATAYAVDASSREEVQVAAARMRRDVGVVTLVVLGGDALAPCLPLLQQPPGLIERTVATSLFSLFWTLEAFLPVMLERGRGHVVTLMSASSLRPEPYMVPYCAAQYAVRGLMEALEAEIQQDKRSNSIKFTTIYTWKINSKRNLETPRFSYLPVLNSQQIAESVVDAILKNYHQRSIPALLLPISHLQRLLPHSVLHMTNKFLHRAVEVD